MVKLEIRSRAEKLCSGRSLTIEATSYQPLAPGQKVHETFHHKGPFTTKGTHSTPLSQAQGRSRASQGQATGAKGKPFQTHAKWHPYASNPRQSGMAWDDPTQTHANLGWVWEGEGPRRARLSPKSHVINDIENKSHHGGTETQRKAGKGLPLRNTG